MPLHGFSYELHLSYWNLSQLIWTFSLEIYFWNSQKQLHSKLLRFWWRQNTGPTSLRGRIWFMPIFFIFVVAFFLYQTYSNDIWQLSDRVFDFLCFFLAGKSNAKIRTHTNKVPHGIWISNINFVISSNLPSAGFALEELQIALATENQ